jgi:DNA adenine methylase
LKYLGGKTRLAKQIAYHVQPAGPWWEPFCGGLSCSKALAHYYPVGLLSDVSVPLISLYQAVRSGWNPPRHLTREEHARAKYLPDTDPLKGFAGFACSYAGNFFAGYVGIQKVYSKSHPNGMNQDPIRHASKSLLLDCRGGLLEECKFTTADFLSVRPEQGRFESIYCDPPYEGTTKYRGTPEFDHEKLWVRCKHWAILGTRVFVSELSCPIEHEVVFEKSYEARCGYKGQKNGHKTEKLFRIIS